MNGRPITFRPPTPTFEEGLAFAGYLDEAAEGFFRFMLGRGFMPVIAQAFLQPDHDLSHQYTTFAERDGDLVGMVSGYTAEQHRRASRRPLKQAAGQWHLRMRIVVALFAPLMRIIDSIADDDFYVQAIAVDEERRGEGLGSMLMDFLQEHASASGAARLALDVSARNENAQRFYARRGFIVESRWPKRMRLPSLEFYRMIKPLH